MLRIVVSIGLTMTILIKGGDPRRSPQVVSSSDGPGVGLAVPDPPLLSYTSGRLVRQVLEEVVGLLGRGATTRARSRLGGRLLLLPRRGPPPVGGVVGGRPGGARGRRGLGQAHHLLEAGLQHV